MRTSCAMLHYAKITFDLAIKPNFNQTKSNVVEKEDFGMEHYFLRVSRVYSLSPFLASFSETIEKARRTESIHLSIS